MTAGLEITLFTDPAPIARGPRFNPVETYDTSGSRSRKLAKCGTRAICAARPALVLAQVRARSSSGCIPPVRCARWSRISLLHSGMRIYLTGARGDCQRATERLWACGNASPPSTLS